MVTVGGLQEGREGGGGRVTDQGWARFLDGKLNTQ